MNPSLESQAARMAVLGVGTESLLVMLALLLVLVGVIGRYVYQITLGATKSPAASGWTERTPAQMDLGPVRGSYTNYSPWESRVGASLVVIGAVCGLIWLLSDSTGFKAGAIIGLVFGVPVVLFATLKRIDRLDVHERGFVLRKGKSKPISVYYSEVANCSKIIVETDGHRVLKGVAIDLHDGSDLQVGADFYKLGKLAIELMRLCDPQETAAWDAAQAAPPSEAVRTQGAGAEELGDEIERFTTGARGDVQVCVGTALAVGAAVLSGAFLMNGGPDVNRFRVIFIGGFICFFGVLLIVAGFLLRRVCLVLHRNGLVYVVGWGRHTLQYADIRRVNVVSTDGVPSVIALTLRDNKVMSLSQFKNIAGAAQRIEELAASPEGSE
jgi:hypothetical protein